MGDRLWDTLGLPHTHGHPIESLAFQQILTVFQQGTLQQQVASQLYVPKWVALAHWHCGQGRGAKTPLSPAALALRCSQPPAPLPSSLSLSLSLSRRLPSSRRAALAQCQCWSSLPVPSAGPGWQCPQRGCSNASDMLHAVPVGQESPAGHRAHSHAAAPLRAAPAAAGR